MFKNIVILLTFMLKIRSNFVTINVIITIENQGET